ncbi:MAG: type II toxin-antitoxin system YafO family toxin [Gammaproteobacteria bacterium]|nr:MAG: type II toxin-antitoxin system YafO family toxin [Gammaproteobacteria bacterium]
MIRLFEGSIFKGQLTAAERTQLITDFRLYKEEGALPQTFGRDVPYDHPNTLPSVLAEELRHLHLAEEGVPFPVHTIQFSRTSDTHLIYCSGALDPNCYALIAILSPNAHDQALDRDQMLKLARSAELFRNQH